MIPRYNFKRGTWYIDREELHASKGYKRQILGVEYLFKMKEALIPEERERLRNEFKQKLEKLSGG